MILICGLDDLVEEAAGEDDDVTMALALDPAELLLTTLVAMAATAGTAAAGLAGWDTVGALDRLPPTLFTALWPTLDAGFLE